MLPLESLKQLEEKIRQAGTVFIASHINPDGDAIGSGLAMKNLLEEMGKKVYMAIPNHMPDFLKWMKGSSDILVYTCHREKIKKHLSSADLVIFLDFNDSGRLGDMWDVFEKHAAFRILIDHHPGPEAIASLIISETAYGSTSEIIVDLVKQLEWGSSMNSEISACLYAGIMTDTGNFSFACEYPGVWENIAYLMSFGINRQEIFSRIYDNYSEDRMRMMGFALHRKMKILSTLRSGIISISAEELKEFNHKIGDTEGFVNLPFSIRGIVFSALLIEKENHVRLSLRSRGNFSVNELARKHFSGGGHFNAAGGEMSLPLNEAEQSLIKILEEYSEKLKNA